MAGSHFHRDGQLEFGKARKPSAELGEKPAKIIAFSENFHGGFGGFAGFSCFSLSDCDNMVNKLLHSSGPFTCFQFLTQVFSSH